MKHQDFLDGLSKIMQEELLPLLKNKNADYSDDVDPMVNFRDFGWRGVVVRIGDKWERLLSFVKRSWNNPKHKLNNESVEDTLKDLANYAIITLYVKRYEEKEKAERAHRGYDANSYPVPM